MEAAGEKTTDERRRRCDSCTTSLLEKEVFSFKEKALCEKCYLGRKSFGPLGDQVIDCPQCSKPLNKFTVVCFYCKTPIREVGKVSAEVKGMGIRIIVFFVACLVFAIAGVALGPVSTAAGGSQGRAALLGVLGPMFALMGLFRLLFGMVFKKVPFLGTFLGIILGVILVALGIVLLVTLPFP